MALYANMRDYRFSDNIDDIRGSELYGSDNEKLGTIDDVIFDNSTGDVRYLVVDTGGWLSSKKFLVPARQVMTATEGEDRGYRVALRREQIERFPEYREESIDRDEDWDDYERRYHDSYKLTETGDVLHQEGSTNIITPAQGEMTASGGRSSIEGRDLTLIYEGVKCIHSRFCVTWGPKVFIANVKGPWINPDNMPTEALAEIAHVCVSGAIRYKRKDGRPDEQPPAVNLISVRENGPYAFRADIQLDGAPGFSHRMTIGLRRSRTGS